MKISYSWLKEYIDINEAPEKVATILTDIGLEVEGVEVFEEIKGGLKGLVIGEVLTCDKHPNADKLSLTTVTIGNNKPLRIVCGAPNVAAGQKVVVATLGTEIHMGDKRFTINRTKIRGEESEGMICAEDEIGLGHNHDGIMILDNKAKPGTPASEYFNISTDTVFEIGLTPNRIDAGSHYGTARDLAAFYSLKQKVRLTKPDISAFKVDDNSLPIPVEIKDKVGCRRFTGLTISDLRIAPSPRWLQQHVSAIGLSPINNVVDITNYVLHELGQPLHAYDVDKFKNNKIVVQRLPEDTPFITLDAEERKLSDMDVMVCDGDIPACIGGVFGGLLSGVSDTTKKIFLEAAYFDPVAIRKTARRHGLNTDSSFRFERGVDPENTLFALKRAAILIKEITGGRISSEIIDEYPAPILPVKVIMKYNHIDRLIGQHLDKFTIARILTSLDMEILEENDDQFKVKIPPYRVDVTREADVIEEILRIYGYNNVEVSTKLNSSIHYHIKPDNEYLVNLVSDYLSDNGFNEIMSNSLTKADYYNELHSFPKEKLVPMLNPLSADLNVMRQTLLFGGLEAIERNIHHKNPNLRLYEYGRVYSLKGSDLKDFKNFTEVPTIGLFITGNKQEQSWAVEETPSTFFQLKAYYLNILKKLCIEPATFIIDSLEGYEDIYSGGLEYKYKGQSVIRAGIVNSKLLVSHDIETEVFFAEMNWEQLLLLYGSKGRFTDLPKFPEVRRDLALLLDESIQFAEIEKLAFETENKVLRKVNLFDYFKGKNIPKGKKSYAVSFILQDLTKTLTDKEIDRIMSGITQALIKNLKAELR
jgi:phenylalanyl-tRNA synthetase beta chain